MAAQGETFDVALSSELTTSLLVKEGRMKADTHTRILSPGIGVAVLRSAFRVRAPPFATFSNGAQAVRTDPLTTSWATTQSSAMLVAEFRPRSSVDTGRRVMNNRALMAILVGLLLMVTVPLVALADPPAGGIAGLAARVAALEAAIAVLEGQNNWAIVSSQGALLGGKNAVSAAHVSTGTYQVNFNRDVSACAVVASSGADGEVTFGDIVAVPGDAPQRIVVFTTGRFGPGLLDLAFTVNVSCP